MNSFTSPRARRPVNARVIAVSPRGSSRAAVRLARARLRAEEERGADLRGGRAGGERGAHAVAIADPTCRNERQLDGRGDPADELEQRDISVGAVGPAAAVAAGLGALRDEHVGAGGVCRLRFGDSS